MSQCLLCQTSVSEKLRFLDLLLLKKREAGLCTECWSRFQMISDMHCPTCCKDGESQICQDCKAWQKKGENISHYSCYTYNQAMKEYFSRYKFQGDYLLHTVFAPILSEKLKIFKAYTLVPIPVSSERFLQRGFNQVTEIVKAAGLPFKELLVKEDTVAQSSKSRSERLETQQCFQVKEGVTLPEKILLIDDIYTTGTTLYLAKQVLLEVGVKKIVTFSIAR